MSASTLPDTAPSMVAAGAGPPHAATLVRRGVIATLLRMAFPMLAGTFALTAYNLTDTWFVSRLGTLPLAAMGFTFPVVGILGCVAGGLGSGVTTLVSHALGRGDHADAVQVVSRGLTFTVLVSLLMTIAGVLSLDLVFSRLGAQGAVRGLVGEYMRTWYLGAAFMALPMVGNGVLISAGDSRNAGRFMLLGTLLNAVLDPIMIFGWWGFPALGIRGAALATVIAQGVATGWLAYLLVWRHRLLVFRRWPLAAYAVTVRRILGFGIPSMLSMMLMPLSGTVITRLLVGFGNEAVAAAGAAGRIEMFAFVIPMALGISLTPFVSQNFGANRLDRIRRALGVSMRFAFFYGAGVAVVFCLGAPWLARVFSQDPLVQEIMVPCLRIVAFGYGMLEIHRYCGFFLTGLHQPVCATVLNAVRVLILLIPFSYVGARFVGLPGVFWGRLATDWAAAAVGLLWVRSYMHRLGAGGSP